MIRVYDGSAHRLTEERQLPSDGWIDVDDPDDGHQASEVVTNGGG
jgi:hypothetical protein